MISGELEWLGRDWGGNIAAGSRLGRGPVRCYGAWPMEGRNVYFDIVEVDWCGRARVQGRVAGGRCEGRLVAGLGTVWRTCGRLDEGTCGDDGCDRVYDLVIEEMYFSGYMTK